MEAEDPLVIQCRARVGLLIGGKWRLDALIGVGGMAAVYMATHRNGSMAALKILHEDVARNTEVRERFLREAYIANKVNHPGTVRVLDDDKDEHGAPYIVMELLRGESIEAKAHKAGGWLSIAETLHILDETLAVLEAAHEQTIVHRDLKPENLFMTEQGQVKVLDFGIARLREQNTRRTQTGMVMGTPAFMAPEQAMGRWNDVDARTDLWAMGATAYTLLTGLPVHDAETAGEMLVAAATRPARSLARVLNAAPHALVALIDRALAFDREQRFPDALTFRKELAKVRSGLTSESSSASNVNPAAQPLVPATVHGNRAPSALFSPGTDDDDDGPQKVETYDPSLASDAEIELMTRAFAALQHALVATRQYGAEHPEAKRRFDEAFREFASGLMTCDIALAWNLTPYSFGARDRVIWEPDPPWNRIPYHFFSDGVRMMGMAPGLDENEFRSWLKLLMLDPSVDLAPEDDLVTMLWDASFEHLFFQAVDSFAEGNQDQRARYEAERNDVLANAHADHRAGLTESLADDAARPRKGGAKQDALEKSRELFRVLARGDATDAEAAARVANLNVLEESPDEAEAARSLAIDDTAVALLAARMEVDVAATSERFVVAAAEAFVTSARTGRSASVTGPLRRAVDSLGNGAPGKAIDMILELRDAVSVDGNETETTSLRDTITSEVLSSATLLAILRGSQKLEGDARSEYLRGVAKVLGCIQSQHFDSALAFLPDAPEGPVLELLLGFISRIARGNELKIGALFPRLPVEVALMMVRLLAETDTPAAQDAVAMAAQSPHALVRIEALGHVEGAASPRLRAEMRRLLEDPDGNVRLAALRAMESHSIAIAGPFLVLRIQEGDFSKLPLDERSQALQTLCRLRAKRGEEVCMALLSDSHLLRSAASEETRELAAQYLAEVASSDPAFFLLDEIAKSTIFRNSKRVRDAATAALVRLRERAAEAERRKTERRSLIASKRSGVVSGVPSELTSGAPGPSVSRAPTPAIRGAAMHSRSPSAGPLISQAPSGPSPSRAATMPLISRAPAAAPSGASRPAAAPLISRAPGAAPGASRASHAEPLNSRAPSGLGGASKLPTGSQQAREPAGASRPAVTGSQVSRAPAAPGGTKPGAESPVPAVNKTGSSAQRDSQPPPGREARGQQ